MSKTLVVYKNGLDVLLYLASASLSSICESEGGGRSCTFIFDETVVDIVYYVLYV